MVSVTPKMRRPLFSLKKVAANDASQTHTRSIHATSASTQLKAAPKASAVPSPAIRSDTRPSMISRTSSSSWVDATSPHLASSGPTPGAHSRDEKAHGPSSPSPSSAQFQFPAPIDPKSPSRTQSSTDDRDRVNKTTKEESDPHAAFAKGYTSQRMLHGTETSPGRPRSRSSPGDRGLVPLPRHVKTRSHFSIPDVMVTAAEEDGEKVYFEVAVSDNDRRIKLHNEPTNQSQNSTNSLCENQTAHVTRKSLSEKIKPFLQRDSTDKEGLPQVPALPEQGSSNESVNGLHRAPKSTISNLFGKKDKKAEVPAVAVFTPAEVPQRSNSPYDHPCSAFDSSGSLPLLSSKDSLPSSSTSSHQPHTPPACEGSGFPTLTFIKKAGSKAVTTSSTAVMPRNAVGKRDHKARQKEELALIKDLAKVDKMVREHDAKARKREADYAASKARVPSSTSRMMTIFAVTKKGGTPARKGSVVKRTGSSVGTGKRGGRAAATQQSRTTASSATHRGVTDMATSQNGSSTPALIQSGTERTGGHKEEGTDFSRFAGPEEANADASPYHDSPAAAEKLSEESDERPSFSGADWTADLRTTGLTSLAGKTGLRLGDFSADETVDSTTSSEYETGDSVRIDVALPREDSAVIPLAMEGSVEEDGISPASTLSSNVHRAFERADKATEQFCKVDDVRSNGQLKSTAVPTVTLLQQPVRPPRRQYTSPPTYNSEAKSSGQVQPMVAKRRPSMGEMEGKVRSTPLGSISSNTSYPPPITTHMVSYTVGQIIPDTPLSVSGSRCGSPALQSSGKMASPTEYAPFRAVMMSAGGASVLANRAGQRA